MNLENYKIPEKKDSQPTFLHSVVEEINAYCYGESGIKDPDCWKMWLGIGKRIGAGQLKAKLDYVKSRNIKSARYLLACTRQN